MYIWVLCLRSFGLSTFRSVCLCQLLSFFHKKDNQSLASGLWCILNYVNLCNIYHTWILKSKKLTSFTVFTYKTAASTSLQNCCSVSRIILLLLLKSQPGSCCRPRAPEEIRWSGPVDSYLAAGAAGEAEGPRTQQHSSSSHWSSSLHQLHLRPQSHSRRLCFIYRLSEHFASHMNTIIN